MKALVDTGPALAAKRASRDAWKRQIAKILTDPVIRAEYPKMRAKKIRFYLDSTKKPRSMSYLRALIREVRTELKRPLSPKVAISLDAPMSQRPQSPVQRDALAGFRDEVVKVPLVPPRSRESVDRLAGFRDPD